MTAALVASFTSCDLNTFPADRLDNDQAIKSIGDLVKARNGAYDMLVDIYHNPLVIGGELQADYANAVMSFNNWYGGLHRWDFTYADGDVRNLWNNSYKTIAQTNFVFQNVEGLEIDPADQTDYNIVIGEMHLIRALTMYELVLKFSPAYSSSTANTANAGIVVLTDFDPSALPGRNTVQETYDQILADLTQAKSLMSGVAGAANATDLTIDCVTALEARVHLQMGNYAQALTAANSLIGKSTYALATTEDDFRKIWAEDAGSEVIFKFYASKTELPPAVFGEQFVVEMTRAATDVRPAGVRIVPQYIPTQTLLDMYAENDIRKGVYFLKAEDGLCEIGALDIPSPVYIMNKYPGNVELQTTAGTKNFRNTFKLFRIAEMYLIAAEAAVATNGDAATPLNALRTARGLAALTSVTLADVKAERVREMIFEGNRISDLKRWGDPLMSRTPQTGTLADGTPATLITSGANYENLSVSAGDYRFLWPIPSDEIYANQNLAPQQNPGWEK